MEDIIKDFFVEDEKKFRIEDVMGLIQGVSKYSKLLGRDGRVHILNKNLSGVNKLKLFLITRYLGAKLGKLKPELKINEDIKEASIKEISDFLGVPDYNARSRMSQLVNESFARRPKDGFIEVENFQIEDFVKSLEEMSQKSKPRKIKQKNNDKGNKSPKPKLKKKINIDEAKFFELASKNLDIEESKLRDSIFILEDKGLKFHDVPGSTKTAKQRAVILAGAYLLLIGTGKRTFKTRLMTNICYNSAVDTSNIKLTVFDMKNSSLIGKAEAKSQENILREAGKTEAQAILKGMCK
jgi:hypothetical protein